jgi:hypothetical protein
MKVEAKKKNAGINLDRTVQFFIEYAEDII